MQIFLTNIYLFLMAAVLAILEIQIEGPHGWAKNLPTWKPQPGNLAGKIYSKIMSGKELTGYHAAMFTFVALIFHLPYVFGLSLTFEHWLQTLSLFFLFIALWDFLWFVFNPHYPLKYFTKENPNHKTFFLGLPVDYYFSIATSLLLVLIGEYFFKYNMVSWWLEHFVLFIIETVLIVLFSLYVLKIDNWDTK